VVGREDGGGGGHEVGRRPATARAHGGPRCPRQGPRVLAVGGRRELAAVASGRRRGRRQAGGGSAGEGWREEGRRRWKETGKGR